MARYSAKQYQTRVLVAMAIYSVFMLLAWPHVATTTSVPLKAALALLAVVPVVYVIVQLTRFIRASDELEQRMHLVALSVATAVVSALSLVAGFLSIAGVLKLDGSVLVWVFPALAGSYGLARWWVMRGYGGGMSCCDDAGLPLHLIFPGMGIVMLAAAWFIRNTRDDLSLGILCGAGVGLMLNGLILGIRRWRRRRYPGD